MKIVQLTTFFHPVVGGVESHVYSLSERLVEMGHEVEVLTSDSNKNGPRLKNSIGKVGNIPIRRFRTILNLSYFHKLFPGVFFYLLKGEYDVVHVHGFRKSESLMALLAAKVKKKKIVLTTHNPFPVEKRSSFLDKAIKFMDLTINKWFTGKFDKIITLVDSEQTILHDKFKVAKKKMITIPNGMEDFFLEPGNESEFYKDLGINPNKWDGIVLGVGRINKVKGYQNLELAVKKLKKILFIFAGGDDGYLDELKKLYRKNRNVLFTETFVPQHKLTNFYKGGDLFVFPSLHEAFGIVLLEALAQGMPVLSSNVGGPKEFLKDKYAVLLDPEDKEAWNQAIKELIYNKDRLASMSQAGIVEAKKYRWSKIATDIFNIYKKL